ncbi:hypothetical protein [Maliponia aquimaris]|uniref:Uncharacterized protein n=1 Tax=Maliponia aquimaris TaxID=1673631 RepID=A0A238KKX3_9RHOB|nr:hypothetical protein [Maliponia aquimaris]SMX43455.1 hypothetical protein MAA8898_02830 [Maliponia aquimaris]
MLYAIPFLSFLSALLWGHLLMREACREALAGLATLLAGVALWLLWQEGRAVGLDVLVYTFAFWGVSLPALLALALGAALGWADRRAEADPVRAQ